VIVRRAAREARKHGGRKKTYAMRGGGLGIWRDYLRKSQNKKIGQLIMAM